MKPVLRLFLSLFLLVSTVQAVPKPQPKPTPTDSLKNEIHQINNRFNQLKRDNDSLGRELILYKVKEDYFSSIVSSLTTHYEWLLGIGLAIALAIVGLIGSLAGIFSWRFIKERLDLLRSELKKDLNSQEEIINKHVHNSKYLEFKLNRQSMIIFDTSYGILYDIRKAKYTKNVADTYLATISLEMTADCVKAYLYIRENDEEWLDITTINTKLAIKRLILEINLLFDGENLTITHEELNSFLDYEASKSLVILEESMGIINDTSIKTELMRALVKINELKAMVKISD